MSEIKFSTADHEAGSFLRVLESEARLDPDARLLLPMALQLGPRDRVALGHIIKRAGEICDQEGEDTALAVLDQIEAILKGRKAHA